VRRAGKTVFETVEITLRIGVLVRLKPHFWQVQILPCLRTDYSNVNGDAG
jgi:hypothetical protein